MKVVPWEEWIAEQMRLDAEAPICALLPVEECECPPREEGIPRLATFVEDRMGA